MAPDPNRRPLRIGVDAHALGRRATGNERFVGNVLRELRSMSDHDFVLFFTDAHVARAWEADGWRVRIMRPAHPSVRIPIVLPRLAREERLDVLFVQYTAPRDPGCPVVTVVHDVSFAEHPDWFSATERRWMPRTIPATMRRAARVVTVSAFSRDEIVRLYGIPPERIVVAHDGVDPRLATAQPRPASAPPGDYLLSVGTASPRKNVAMLRGAFARARAAGLDASLVVAGPGHAPGGERVLATGWIDDATLSGLMQHAAALCYPSRYEGFGLPPVEAMSVGTPALVADIPVMLETVGDAAVRLPAEDEEAWAEAMTRIVTDQAWRAELAARGRQRAAGFTWRDCAAEVLRAVEEAAG